MPDAPHPLNTEVAGLEGAIGRTPLIRLRRASEATGCTILGKAEFMNPGGSVKDRAGLAIIEDAERTGALRPGGTIVEGTAGNTGIGLTLVANARGYRCVIVMPETQSREKIDFLRMIGADLRLVPAAPYRDPANYVHRSRRLAEELGAVWANQFDNLANREGHRHGTGEEIWAGTGGRIDAFTCACGTGGTLGGVSLALKARKPDVRIVLADPEGSGLYGWVKTGELLPEGSSITEGIGQSRVPGNLDGIAIDDAVRIGDAAAEHLEPAADPEEAAAAPVMGPEIDVPALRPQEREVGAGGLRARDDHHRRVARDRLARENHVKPDTGLHLQGVEVVEIGDPRQGEAGDPGLAVTERLQVERVLGRQQRGPGEPRKHPEALPSGPLGDHLVAVVEKRGVAAEAVDDEALDALGILTVKDDP